MMNKQKQTCHLQVSKDKDGGHLPSGIMQARREWNDVFKVLKGKKKRSTNNSIFRETKTRAEGISQQPCPTRDVKLFSLKESDTRWKHPHQRMTSTRNAKSGKHRRLFPCHLKNVFRI